jgi:hypothetical protein
MQEDGIVVERIIPWYNSFRKLLENGRLYDDSCY